MRLKIVDELDFCNPVTIFLKHCNKFPIDISDGDVSIEMCQRDRYIGLITFSIDIQFTLQYSFYENEAKTKENANDA